MTFPTGEDLGHGVHASPGAGGELTISSTRLDLPWRVAEGQVPGTAVLWREGAFEVVARTATKGGIRWTLHFWEDASAMRDVFTLDRETVQIVAAGAEAEARNRRSRWWSLAVLPVLGLAPAALQKKWENEWGFAAGRATSVSAILEMLVGAAGTVQMAAAAFGGEFFIPPILAAPGPLLFLSGAARLAMVFGDGEPVGSPLGLPFAPWAPMTRSEAEPGRPSAIIVEREDGSPAFLRTMLISAAITLGPSSDQLRWARELGVSAIWFTLAGSGAELLGGIVNLQSDLGTAPAWLTGFDFLLIGEGLLRLGSAILGRPMGSVFGWILRPLYRKYLPSTTTDQ
jgi:hypothetical protein